MPGHLAGLYCHQVWIVMKLFVRENNGQIFKLCINYTFTLASLAIKYDRMAITPGKRGILVQHGGKFWQHREFSNISLNIKYFIVNCLFINWCSPIFFLALLHFTSFDKLPSCSCFSHTFILDSWFDMRFNMKWRKGWL